MQAAKGGISIIWSKVLISPKVARSRAEPKARYREEAISEHFQVEVF
jgi:hypothetical protein